MEAITCYCLECKHKLGRFRNSWDMIGTNYYSPIYPALTFENGFTGSGEIRKTDFGSSDTECSLQDVTCKKCSKFLGIRCDSAPEGHNLWRNQLLLRLSNTSCIVDGTKQPAEISVVNRFPLLPQQPSKESSTKPKSRASTAQPSFSGRRKSSSVKPKSVKGQSNSSAGLMLPPPLPPAKEPVQEPEGFQNWAERAIKSQQKDIERLSGAVERIEGNMEAIKKLIEELRNHTKEPATKEAGVSNEPAAPGPVFPGRQIALVEHTDHSNNSDTVSKITQKRKRATSVDTQRLNSVEPASAQLPKSKKRRVSTCNTHENPTADREHPVVEISSSRRGYSPILGQNNGNDLPHQALQLVRASCPPIRSTKVPESGLTRKQMRQSNLESRESLSLVNSFSSPIPLYDQELIITGKRNRGRDTYYGKTRDSEGHLIKPSGKVDGRSLRQKKSSIETNQDIEPLVESSHASGQVREAELNGEAMSKGTPGDAKRGADRLYPSVEDQSSRQQKSTLGSDKENMTPICRSTSPDELSSDAIYMSPRIRVIQRFTAPPSMLRAHFTPTLHGAKENAKALIYPSIEKEDTTPMAQSNSNLVLDPSTPILEAGTAELSAESQTKPFSCGVCKKRYLSLLGLTYHKEHTAACKDTANDEHFLDVKCDACQKSYCSMYSLSRHICKTTPNSSNAITGGVLSRLISTPVTDTSTNPRRDESLRRSIVGSVRDPGVGNKNAIVKATANATQAAQETDIEEARKRTMAVREHLVKETMERELGTSLGGGFIIEI